MSYFLSSFDTIITALWYGRLVIIEKLSFGITTYSFLGWNRSSLFGYSTVISNATCIFWPDGLHQLSWTLREGLQLVGYVHM